MLTLGLIDGDQTKEKRSHLPLRLRKLLPVSNHSLLHETGAVGPNWGNSYNSTHTPRFSLCSTRLRLACTANHIHIRIQQRNGRKTITTLQGVPKEYDPKKLLKAFKSEHTNPNQTA